MKVLINNREEFEKLYPYKVGDKVITKDKFIGTITDIRWQGDSFFVGKEEGDIVYTVQVSTTAQITYQKEDLQPYKEELTMKKKSKLINIQPKLVGNECVHFPIPTGMKLEVKDGMCYLYRDYGEHKEYIDNATPEQLEEDWKEIGKFTVTDEYIKQYKREGVNLQKMERKLDEALEKETTESLNKWLDEEPDKPKAPILSNRYDYAEGKCGYVIPDGYEFDCIKEGFQTEIILKPKQPQYPKTYEECCDVIGISRHDVEIDLPHPYQQKMFNLFKLHICRNAYWKIAGEQMGLDKPWEPNWNELKPKYTIVVIENKFVKHFALTQSYILAFPTEEMRDAFFENFKDLIEQCKEML